jgi:hypothetical protein
MKNEGLFATSAILLVLALIGMMIAAAVNHKQEMEMIMRLETQKMDLESRRIDLEQLRLQQENADGKTHPTQAD